MGDAVAEFRFAHDRGDNSDGVDHAENQAHADAGVFDALPGKPAKRYSCLRPAVQALRHSPQPLVDYAHSAIKSLIFTCIYTLIFTGKFNNKNNNFPTSAITQN